MKLKLSGTAAILAAGLMGLTGCGSGGGTGTTTQPAAPVPVPTASSAPASSPAAEPQGSVELKVADSNLGRIVVDAKGMTVYYFTKDVKDSGKSNCTGECIAAWPPVLARSDSPKVEGVTGTVGTIPTPEGKKQITINGMPIYYWVNDKAPGDTTGQDVNKVWYVVAPNGDMIKNK
jgi:predicted lipoprotein with Yx(FWY)xxD motif